MDANSARCLRCGAILSRYRAPGEELCAPCARAALEEQRPSRVLAPEQLVDAIAGLLLLGRALEPGRRVHLRAELAERGIEADHVDIFQAVQKLRRRHRMRIDAEERQPGYRLESWPYRFTRRRGPAARAAVWLRRQRRLFSLEIGR